MIRLGFRYYLGRVVQWFHGHGTRAHLAESTIGLIREHQAALDDAWSAGYAEGYQDGNRDAGGPSTTRQRRLSPPLDSSLN